MPITPYLPDDSLEPEAVVLAARAFESICLELGLSPKGDRLTSVVAHEVIDAVRGGMRNETAIGLAVLQKFKSNEQ